MSQLLAIVRLWQQQFARALVLHINPVHVAKFLLERQSITIVPTVRFASRFFFHKAERILVRHTARYFHASSESPADTIVSFSPNNIEVCGITIY